MASATAAGAAIEETAACGQTPHRSSAAGVNGADGIGGS